jgi:hypothetical protein
VTAKAALVAVCGLGLVLAAVVAARWGSLRRDADAQSPPAEAQSATQTVRRVLRTVVIGVVGGGLAGILVGGFGGRLIMRLLAATSGPSAQGLITQADETVGEVTLNGTLALVVFGGLALGVAGGVAYVAIRRWLPSPAWLSGLAFGALILAMTRPVDLLDPGNVDFVILRPKGLAVVLLLVLPLFYGVVLAAVVERLDRSYPLLSARPAAIAAYTPLVVFAVPFLAAILLVVLVLAAGLHQADAIRRRWRSTAVDRAGRALLALAGLAGGAWIGTSVADILSG